jgi:GDP-4-dehydro-6-deoxy-D-mannose reductase
LQDPVLQTGALDRWRDFLDVRDVCAAYVAALQRGAEIPSGTAINIGSGVPRRIADLLAALISRTAVPVEVHADAGKMRQVDTPIAVGDARRAGTLLGWAPQTNWDVTLDSIMADWRARVRSE